MQATIEQQLISKYDDSSVLDVRQAAALLGLKPDRIRYLINTRGLPKFKVQNQSGKNGYAWRIEKSKLDDWVAKNPHLISETSRPRKESGNGKVFTERYTLRSTQTWEALHNKTVKIKVMREEGRLYVLGLEANGKMHVIVEGK